MFPFPFSFLGAAADVPLELIDNNFAMEFDGTGEYTSAPNSMSALTGLSVSAWVKPTATGTGAAEAILSTEAASPNRGFYLSLFVGSEYRWQVSTDGSNKDSLDAGTIVLNEWTHIAATWNQSTMNLYVNGSLADTMSTVNATGTFSTTNNMFIGQRTSGAGFFPGDIDEVAVWNKALALEDVQTIYNATSNNPGKCSNLFTGGLKDGLQYWNRMGDN